MRKWDECHKPKNATNEEGQKAASIHKPGVVCHTHRVTTKEGGTSQASTAGINEKRRVMPVSSFREKMFPDLVVWSIKAAGCSRRGLFEHV